MSVLNIISSHFHFTISSSHFSSACLAICNVPLNIQTPTHTHTPTPSMSNYTMFPKYNCGLGRLTIYILIEFGYVDHKWYHLKQYYFPPRPSV